MIQKPIQSDAIVFVVDDDLALRDGISSLLQSVGVKVQAFGSTAEFLQSKRPDLPCCMLLDVRLPGMSGLDFQAELSKLGIHIPIVFMTGHADVPMGVKAIKAGAVEFLCKPIREQDLLDAVRIAIERDRTQRDVDASISHIGASFDLLTPREREVMSLVVTGLMNKQVAAKLGVSDITVKVHRGSVMRKMKARSLADLVRMADALVAHSARQSH